MSHEIKPVRYHRRNISISLKTLYRCTYLISLIKESVGPKRLSVTALSGQLMIGDVKTSLFFLA